MSVLFPAKPAAFLSDFPRPARNNFPTISVKTVEQYCCNMPLPQSYPALMSKKSTNQKRVHIPRTLNEYHPESLRTRECFCSRSLYRILGRILLWHSHILSSR